jgi:hypothetical protein
MIRHLRPASSGLSFELRVCAWLATDLIRRSVRYVKMNQA